MVFRFLTLMARREKTRSRHFTMMYGDDKRMGVNHCGAYANSHHDGTPQGVKQSRAVPEYVEPEI